MSKLGKAYEPKDVEGPLYDWWDIEVDHIDEPGELAYLRYPQMDGGDGVVVAMTRAELPY